MHFLNDPKEQAILKELCDKHEVPFELVMDLLKEAKNFDQFAFSASQKLDQRIKELIEAWAEE